MFKSQLVGRSIGSTGSEEDVSEQIVIVLKTRFLGYAYCDREVFYTKCYLKSNESSEGIATWTQLLIPRRRPFWVKWCLQVDGVRKVN